MAASKPHAGGERFDLCSGTTIICTAAPFGGVSSISSHAPTPTARGWGSLVLVSDGAEHASVGLSVGRAGE